MSVTHNEQGVTCSCHAGCRREDLASKIGLPIAEWSTREGMVRRSRPLDKSNASRSKRKNLSSLQETIAWLESSNAWDLVSRHRSTDRAGEGRSYVLRFVPRAGRDKQFKTAVPRGNGRWASERPKGHRLPELLAAPEVWICEGEQCADRLS